MVICSVCLEDAFIAATYRSASLVVSVVQFQASRYIRADQIIQLTSKEILGAHGYLFQSFLSQLSTT